MNIIDYDPKCYGIYDPKCYGISDDADSCYPALVTAGCGCCRAYRRVTRENLDEAIRQTQEWLAVLQALQPVDYPEGVEGGE